MSKLVVRKDVKKREVSLRGQNFYMSIVELLKKGYHPSRIAINLKVSRQRINHYIAKLKANGSIKKEGYGVWTCKNLTLEDVKIEPRVAMPKVKIFTSENDVRGHAFVYKLYIPKGIKNWDNKEDFFIRKGLKYKLVGFNNSTVSFILNGWKVWLSNNSVTFYVPKWKSYFCDNALGSKSLAINDFVNKVKELESLLMFSLKTVNKSQNNGYLFKVSRHHYALVKNSLAKQYDSNGKKLEVYDEKGLWLWIDNSYNLHELETGNDPKSDENNLFIQNFMNDLKSHPTTFSQLNGKVSVLKEDNSLLKQQNATIMNTLVAFTEQIQLHLSVQIEQKDTMKMIKDYIKELRDLNKKEK